MKNQIMNCTDNTVYSLGVVSLLLRLLLGYSSLFAISNLLSAVLLGIFVVCMLWVLINRPMTEMEFIVVASAGIVCVYSYTQMNNYYLLASYLCMAASKNIDLKSVLSYSYRVKAFFLTIHILIYVFVSFTNPESIDYVYRLDGIPRHYFFLGHANTFSMFLMWTFFEYIYVHYEQITMKSIVVIFALDMCLNYFSDSSTNMILITVVLMIVVYKKIYPSKKLSAIRFFAKYGYALMAVFFCGITVAYQYLSGTVLNIYLKLNDLLTSRLIHGAYVYSNYGMTLFGKEINFPENDYWQGYWFNGIACDNAYIWYMVSFGTLFMIIISVMFLKNAKKFNDIEIIMTCAYVLYSVTENYVTNAVFCFPLIFLAQYAFKADENINRRFKITLT